MDGSGKPETSTNQELSTRELMMQVMTELGTKKKEFGVVSIGTDPKDSNNRVDFFIEPIDVQEGRSIDDGGSADLVFVTTDGFFAIRFPPTEESKKAYDKLKNGLSQQLMQKDGDMVAGRGEFSFKYTKGRMDTLFLTDRVISNRDYNGTVPENDSSMHPRLVSVDKETVDRAFEASRERARELKMMDPKTGSRLQQINQAGDSLLDKMKGS